MHKIPLALLLVGALGACATPPATLPPPPPLPVPNTSVTGSVQALEDRAPLAGVSVTLERNGAVVRTTTTGAPGLFSLPAVAASGYTVRYSKSGYLTAVLANLDLTANRPLSAPPVQLIPAGRNEGGSASGIVKDSRTGLALANATVRLRAGLNARTGPVVATTTTDENGVYTFQGLPPGYYTAEVSSGDYITSYFNLAVSGGTLIDNQNVSISPPLAADELRVVLTWGAAPADLDAHFTGPNGTGRFHVYYGNRGPLTAGDTRVELDVDDTTSYGPETVTVRKAGNGLYRYAVHDYTNGGRANSTALSRSGARVQVYSGASAEPLLDEYVPAGRTGDVWTVFELQDGNVRAVNRVDASGASGIQSLKTPR